MRRKRLSSLSFLFPCPRTLICMKNKKLLKFLKKDGRCLFSIGRYLIPTYYKTRKGCTISLKANRNKALIEKFK